MTSLPKKAWSHPLISCFKNCTRKSSSLKIELQTYYKIVKSIPRKEQLEISKYWPVGAPKQKRWFVENIKITALPVDVVQYNHEDDNDSSLLKIMEGKLEWRESMQKFC